MSARRFVAWIGPCGGWASVAIGATPETVEAEARAWVLGEHYQRFGRFPVMVRVTTYDARQRLISEQEVVR